MSTSDPNPPQIGFEDPGAVDYAFDADEDNPNARGLHSDAACTFAWVTDGFQAIQVFLDPALTDRTEELCGVVEQWSGALRDIDGLSDAARRYSHEENVNASVYERPPDEMSTGTVAIAFTIG